jgi:putative ABC transport system ATP-binding protein
MPPDTAPPDTAPPDVTLPDTVGEPARRHTPASTDAKPAGSVGPDGPAPWVIEMHDIGLRGMSPPRAGPHRRSERGRHRHQSAPGQGSTAHQPTPTSAPGLLNLSVRHGELVTVTGPAGSGKSALLHVIGLVDRPATGSYLLNGRNTAKLGDRERAALRGYQIGLQFQRPHLLPVRSTLENVALPLCYAGLPPRERAEAALAAIDRVGLMDRAHVLTAELSASERKLVSIARALATGPKMVLFDDPTAGLDEPTAARIISLVISLHRDGRTVFIATDDQLAAAYSSQRIALARRQ